MYDGLGLGAVLALSLCLLGGCVTVQPFGGRDNTLHETTLDGEGQAKVLWLPISGFISDTPSSGAFGLVQRPSTLAMVDRALDKAADDDTVKAVVLRINSPGGTVSAADEIYARVMRYHEQTGVPVVASLAGVATSGGYYVAMAADQVIAQPTTITGSIGVLILGVNAAGLMDKLGLTDQTVTSAEHKDIMSPLRPPQADEHAIVQSVVDSLYRRFVDVVRTARPDLDTDQLEMITDGRIFAAEDARRLGLVDRIGHLHDVIALARSRAGDDDARIVRYYQGNSAPATLVADSRVGDGRLAVSAAGIPIDMSTATEATPEPLYLWQPGLAR
ncbi:putative signal peptide peptidase SppA [Salinisphaera sp. T31B1]